MDAKVAGSGDVEGARNVYTGRFDRLAERRGDTAWVAAALAGPGTRLLPLWQGRQPVIDTPDGPRLASLEARSFGRSTAADRAVVLLGATDGVPWFALDLGDEGEAPPLDPAQLDGKFREQHRFADLREVGALLPPAEAALTATARGLLGWHAAHRFCGRCGADTTPEDAGHRLRCAGCGASHHPRIEPAVIMLVTDDADRCVLGRSRRHPAGMHSCFAGFVEPGESLEAAVEREVFEEVGLQVADVRYHSSQPWPFPAQLMIGFTARAATFDIHIDDSEIRSARWFSRDELVRSPEDDTLRLPRPDSVARRLVEDWMRAG